MLSINFVITGFYFFLIQIKFYSNTIKYLFKKDLDLIEGSKANRL